jgi:hypothetical protein
VTEKAEENEPQEPVAPAEGEAPVEGDAPKEGDAPSEGHAPAKGEAPEEAGASPESGGDETPAADDTPSKDEASKDEAPPKEGAAAKPAKEPRAKRAEPSVVVTPRSWIARRGYLLLGLVLLLIYLPTLARGATFSDGPELVAAIRGLGVAHPTGYPIFILAIHAFAKLPLPIPYIMKVELFNALCGAIGSVLAAYTTRALIDITRKPEEDPRDADIAGLVAGVLLGLSPMLWGQLHIPEVYPLHFLLTASAGYLWMRFETTRREIYIVGAALPMGMGLAHHVTMVYMLPAAFIYLMARKPVFFVAWITTPVQWLIRKLKPDFREGHELPPAWGFLLANVVGFLPLLSYYYLIWANDHSAGVPWGDVHNWENLYNHFTGRQYQGFMHKLDLAGHLARIKVIPDIFDQQFLPVGTVLFLSGVAVTFQRALRPALFFFPYLVFNAAHGVHYAVGDYGTYYIPGFYCCAIFMGPGLAWLLDVARTRPADMRAPYGLSAVGSMLVTAAVTISIYGRFTKRLPDWLAGHPLYLAVPLGVLGLSALGTAIVAQRRRKDAPHAPPWVLPAVVGAGIVFPVVPAAISRGVSIAGELTIGESYGRELASRIPKGSILLTQGDGFLFSMWYANHVLDMGTEFVTLDAPNVRTPWFHRYVKTHNPLSCDPLGPLATRDPAQFAARCDTYDKRMTLKDGSTWIGLELIGNRRPFPGSKAATAKVLRGNDPRCAETKFKNEHLMKECRCFGYGKRFAAQEAVLEEDCVESAEEGGVVPREPVEIFTQRILEDYLDERPVFERNVLTRWDGLRDNPRGWDGPSYQRVSADYALVSRGRFNQIVYSEDIAGFDPCAGDTLRELPLRKLHEPRLRPRGVARRRPYRPNEMPTLITASWLLTGPKGRDDEATRLFGAREGVWARFDWYEKFRWDAAKPDKHGPKLHHAVRLCVFDPHGKKVATRMTRSGPGQHDAVELLRAEAHEPGLWRLQGCTTGEIGESPLTEAEARACQAVILDYDFTVEARP